MNFHLLQKSISHIIFPLTFQPLDIYTVITDIDNMIQNKLERTIEAEVDYYKETLMNYQFGLANQDLK